jgi:predicted RNA-binding protein with RPS1 domain
VHVSSMAKTLVKDPRAIVKPGDIMRVKVSDVDKPRKRIALTLRLDDEVGRNPSGVRAAAARADDGQRTPPPSRLLQWARCRSSNPGLRRPGCSRRRRRRYGRQAKRAYVGWRARRSGRSGAGLDDAHGISTSAGRFLVTVTGRLRMLTTLALACGGPRNGRSADRLPSRRRPCRARARI